MGGTLSCGGKGRYAPSGEDTAPYTITPEQTYDENHVKTPLITDSSVPPPPYNNNNNNDIKETGTNANHGGRPQWRFWQHLSMRKSKRKPHSEKLLSSPALDEDGVVLPDVVERETGVLKRTSSLRAPPKPPRLFLFRSSTISTPRNSWIENPDRNSRILSQACDFDTKDLSAVVTKDEIKRTDNDNNGMVGKNGNRTSAAETSISDTAEVTVPQVTPGIIVPESVTQKSCSLPYQKRNQDHLSRHRDHYVSKIRIVSPELSRKNVVRHRKKSADITAADRHILILQSATELICQKLDPFMVMEDMTKANILSKEDLTAYHGHPDRRLICENIVQAVMERDYSAFISFCDILRGITDYTMVAAVLDAMKAVYDVIYEVSTNAYHSSPILDDEKTVSFDVVYFSLESGKIRSVVELEKSRNGGDTRRYSRDILSSKRNSRLSFHSMTSEASSIFNEDIVNTGIPMVTAAIAGHDLSAAKATALASVIEQHSCVLELHLGKTHLKGPDFDRIGLALSQSSCLRVLDLRLNHIGNEGAAHLSNALLRNRSLRQMNLSSTGIDSDGCKLICESLKSNTSLVEIDLSFLDIGDSGCVFISDMLKQNRNLKKIRLRSSGISWLGCGFLLEGIEQGRTVTELDLSRNFIGDDGIKQFYSHMKDDSSLRDLNLENCGFTSAGCSVLSDVIQTNKSIRNLDLSVNFVGDLGVLKLSNALVRNKHIKTLGLNMCGISNDGFSKLLDILESNTTLILLKLCYNRLGKEHVNPEATSDNLKYRIRIVTSSNPKLKLLLWGNTFDEAHGQEQFSSDIVVAL